MKGISVVWLSKTGLTNLNSGEGGANLVDVKKFKRMGKEYPYVSGQAMRYYFKEAIRRNLKSEEKVCRPDDKGETCGGIEGCVSCDLFGFMATKEKVGAKTRVSPVKVAPATGLLPFEENSVVDFLTRRKPQEKAEERGGDIVNVEIGTNIYKCGVAIDVARVGTEEEWTKNKFELKSQIDDNERISRISKVLDAIRFFTDYSKQARLLTDFTPDIICITFQNRYSHRLQKLLEFTDGARINQEKLKQILDDVKEYSKEIRFGMLSGTIDNEEAVRKIFERYKIQVMAPAEAMNDSLKLLAEMKK